MKISNEALTILRAELPRGSVPQIRQRLLKRNISFSHQYIYRCLDPNQPDYKEIIIREAVSLYEELTKGAVDLEERVLKVRKALQ
jgi:hypothetical protein